MLVKARVTREVVQRVFMLRNVEVLRAIEFIRT